MQFSKSPPPPRPCSEYRDLSRMIAALRERRDSVDEVIAALQPVAALRWKGKGRPPSWVASLQAKAGATSARYPR